MRRPRWLGLLLTACGTGTDAEGSASNDSLQTATPTTVGGDATSASDDGSGTATAADGTGGGGAKFDVAEGGTPDVGPPRRTCKVVDDMDAVGDCTEQSPPDSFEPDVQWTWTGPAGEISIVPALVANFTDDNADGATDLCDVPDVVVVAGVDLNIGRIWLLDGETGSEHFQIPLDVAVSVTPALGDLDGDGLPEIVAATPGGLFNVNQPSYLVAFEHDGAVKWQNDAPIDHGQGFAIALADLDADGDVEVVADDTVVDHEGTTMWSMPGNQAGWAMYDVWHCTATAAADLDDDGQQEVVLGQTAFRHDGTPYYANPGIEPGFPQIADLDDDPEPEVLVTTRQGASILEHDGTIKLVDQTPTGDASPAWFRPATVHDFDGDDVSEVALSSATHYSVHEPDLATQLWIANVVDGSGWSAGTAFDFLGDGVAEAMYTDEINLYVYDGDGNPLLTVPRSSPTLIEYPTVADVDNDGSAEILVVSYGAPAPALQVIRDVRDRWIQARRIWNQHTYHVTNVREDGTIPQVEPKSWTLLNTYRTNAQIEGGSVCKPRPEG
jgi:hypothetical protein